MTLAAIVAFSLCFTVAWVLWLPAVWRLRNAKGKRRITEWHHFYIGLALYALGCARHEPRVAAVGLSMMLDDGGMHFTQLAFGVRSEVEGGPPWLWHLAFRYLAYNPAVWLLTRVRAARGAR